MPLAGGDRPGGWRVAVPAPPKPSWHQPSLSPLLPPLSPFSWGATKEEEEGGGEGEGESPTRLRRKDDSEEEEGKMVRTSTVSKKKTKKIPRCCCVYSPPSLPSPIPRSPSSFLPPAYTCSILPGCCIQPSRSRRKKGALLDGWTEWNRFAQRLRPSRMHSLPFPPFSFAF